MTRPGRRGRRHRRTVVALSLLALVTASCTSAPLSQTSPSTTYVDANGGTINVGIDEATTGCNPNTATGATWANQLVLAAVLPSAFTVDPTGVSTVNNAFLLQAELVNTMPETIVYTINPKAVWADGVPITASDFIYAWQEQRGTMIDPAHPWGDEASTLGYNDIKSVTGSNKGRTVTVVFATAFSDWQLLFANLLPAHVMEKVGWDPPCTTVNPAIDVAGGPFVIRSVDAERVVLAANPRWWGQPPNLDQIVVRFATGPNQLARWLAVGAVQVAEPTSFGQQFLESVSGLRRAKSELDVSSTFLQLEFSTTSPTTGDTAVREALAYAVDRQTLVDDVVGWADLSIVPSASHLYVQSQNAYPGPNQTPSNSTTSSSSTTTTLPAPGSPYPTGADPGEVDRLLTSAGYVVEFGAWIGPDGQPLTVRLVVDAGDQWAAATSLLLVHQLEQQGVAVQVSTAPDEESTGSALAAGHADLALMPFSTSPYTTQTSAWYTPLLGPPGQGGSANWTNLDDTAVTNSFTNAATELNPVTAQPTYGQADQRLWELMVGLPLFAEPTVLVWTALTDGVQAYPKSPGLLVDAPSWSIRVPVPVSSSASTVDVGPKVT
ncbi:MAG TPA: ABC transporter family substrate-binding protein [Acidimicrobiales bacterium]|nr:ABC transporter family substrate-binding protein [Acidimicrobiales bacterium]